MKWMIIIVCVLSFVILLYSQADYIKITSPHNGWSTERKVEIAGETSVKTKAATIIYNGIPLRLPVGEDGRFSRIFVAAPGLNNIIARLETPSRTLTDKVSFYSKAPAKAMKIVLVWDTDNTDVDLWVIEPTGEKCFYSFKNTKIGGSLDVDVTTGYGPEVYTLAAPTKGSYTIQVNYYSDAGHPQTEARVYVVQYEGTPHEVFKEYETMLTKTGHVVTVDVVTLD
ncbi:MAG: DUF2135 domain-containing protein [Spirochaetes bacterium]|nr:DUF2135 domain-containing protein [Spirochaetota bacterium]